MSPVREIELRRRKIDAIFERANNLAGQPNSEILQADFARYICVLVSGFVEKATAELILYYAQDKAAIPIRTYIDTNLRRLTNVDKERLLQVIGSLDASWRNDVDDFVIDEKKAALNSIVGLRHNIAHGGDGGISLGQIARYWASIQQIIEHLENLLLNNPRAIKAAKKK